MQVAKANSFGVDSSSSRHARTDDRSESYAPLYIKSNLGNLAFDIEELQNLALSRLRLLKAIDSARKTGSTLSTPSSLSDPTRDEIRRLEREFGFHIPPVGNSDREDVIVRDQASHFLARLALCSSHDQRSWLLSTECDLFSTRLERAGISFALAAIRGANGPDIRQIPADLMESLKPDLDTVARSTRRANDNEKTKYYQIAFEHVTPLVKTRRVLVRNGMAYVPDRNIRDVVAAEFRAKLNHGLLAASKAVGLAEQDSRMRNILQAVRAHYAADDVSRSSFDCARGVESISLSQVDSALSSMPLCMRYMLERLREDHHLRHGARMQLGLFLKACGLSMDESLQFWRTEFGRGGIDSDKFDKQYAYNIRHHYGKEGKRKNLSPYACIRIINDRPGPGEHHGCPFREFSENHLSESLRRISVSGQAIPAIVSRARNGNFQAACGLCFDATQPRIGSMGGELEEFIPSHPNEYFIEARRRQSASMAVESTSDDEIDAPNKAIDNLLQAGEAKEVMDIESTNT